MKYDKFNNSHQNHISVEHDRGSISQDKMKNSMCLANNLIYTSQSRVFKHKKHFKNNLAGNSKLSSVGRLWEYRECDLPLDTGKKRLGIASKI